MLHKYKNYYPKLGKNCFVENSAQVIGDVVLGDDVSVWFNAVIRGDVHYIRIGDRTNVQDGCILHVTHGKFPLEIGHDVTIGHGAIIHGAILENYILVGMGAKILDGATIESHSIIAAGSVVGQGFRVPSGMMVAGVPAKIIRPIKDSEREFLNESAQNYLRYKLDYM